MNKELTEEAIREACKPKSDQLNFEDYQGSPRVHRVLRATEGDSEKPVWVYFENEPRPYKPSKTMLRILKAVWGTKASDWIGQYIELYGDPTVKFGGVEVGGIKISKISGIDKPLDMILTVTRGKRAHHRVEPLPPPSPPKKLDPITAFRSWLEAKQITEETACEMIGGRSLEHANEADWQLLRAWAREQAKGATET